MRKALKLAYWVLSKGNHKVNICKKSPFSQQNIYSSWQLKRHSRHYNTKFQNFTICLKQHTHQCQIYCTTCCSSWKRVLVFSLCRTYHGTRTKQHIKHRPYRILMHINYKFSTFLLQVLTEERRTMHYKYTNLSKELPTLKLGDIVKYHVQVKSNLEQ